MEGQGLTQVLALLGDDALTPAGLAAAAGAILAAAVLRGFTGFGFALAAVPLLGLSIPPSRAVPLAVGLQLCGGLIDLRGARRLCHWPTLRWLIAGAVLGSPLGTLALASASPTVARLAIGAICAGGTALLALGARFRGLPGGPATVAVGLASGLFNGLAAMPGPPVVAYYLASPLSPERARASLLVFFLAASATGALSLSVAGLLGPGLLAPTALGVPLMFGGSWIGQRLFRRAAGRGHRAVSIALLAGVAAVSCLKALADLT